MPGSRSGGLAVGASLTCTADTPLTVTQTHVDAGSIVDTATATGIGVAGGQSPVSAPSTVTVPTVGAGPTVSIHTTAVVTPASHQTGVLTGDTIAYSYAVTNTGNVTLAVVHVNDPLVGSVTCPAPAAPGLAPGASLTCTADAPHTVLQPEVDSGSVIDTATATGTDLHANSSPLSAPFVVTTPAAAVPAVGLQMTGTPAGHANPAALLEGNMVVYTYLVSNTGTVMLSSVAVDDPGIGPVTCPAIPAPGLAPGASVTCTADRHYRVTEADVRAGHVATTATASGVAAMGSAHSQPADSMMPTAHLVARVTLAKLAKVNGRAGVKARLGQRIVYHFLVTNVGSASLRTVTVTDPTQGHVTCPRLASPLRPGHSVTCTADHDHLVTLRDVRAGRVTNTAVATGTSGSTGTSKPSRPSTAILRTAPPRDGAVDTIQTDLGRSSTPGLIAASPVAFIAILAIAIYLYRRRS